MKRKCLAIGIILLFVAIAVIPITGISNNRDDTVPPVTTISLNPPEPDGENGWYVSKVTITLNATDNESGVNITEYCIDSGAWMTYIQPFNITTDDPHHEIRCRSIDNAGNIEPWKSVTFAMDRTKPVVLLSYNVTGGNQQEGWNLTFNAHTHDDLSGMNRAEFYLDNELQETVTGPGPDYEWKYHWQYPSVTKFDVRGLIRNPKITDDYVQFYAFIVIILNSVFYSPIIKVYAYDNAGNWDWDIIEEPSFSAHGIYLLQNMTLPHDYTGYIGRFFIWATFYNS